MEWEVGVDVFEVVGVARFEAEPGGFFRNFGKFSAWA